MIADMFRHFFDYHFAENRKLWDSYVMGLAQAQFVQEVDYSLGSVRNQLVHMMSDDEMWFSGLRGVDTPSPLNPADFSDRVVLRARWDAIEQTMRGYLTKLDDAALLTKPFTYEEDRNLLAWQALLHVVNHGTDHRAQVLRLLNDLNVETTAQDYIFYVYDNPL